MHMSLSSMDASMGQMFLRLDPVLRMLLTAVRECREALQKQNTTLDHQRLIGLLKTEVDLTDHLRTAINSLTNDMSRRQLSEGLLVMIDYVTLPLAAILRRSEEIEVWSGVDATMNNRHLVLQSAIWKSMERAADTLRWIVQQIYFDDADVPPRQLPTKTAFKCILACATALPTGREIVASKQSSTVVRLDSGEACIVSLHRAIQCLVKDDASEDLSYRILAEMEGALLARILDSAIALIEPAQQESRQMPSLEAALTTIESLLTAVPDTGAWRRVFPGVYVGLYRRILQSIRAAQQHTQTVVQSARVLLLLLRTTLRRPSPSQPDEATTASCIAKRMQALSVMDSSDQPSTFRGCDNASVDAEEDQFLRQINERSPATLTILVRILAPARSPKIRKQAVDLIRMLLIDTRSCWDVSASEELSTAALESCLVLGQDQDEEVAAAARKLLDDYSKTSLSAQDVELIAAPRIISLFEQLPSLALSSRDTELEELMKMISGYLAMSTSSKLAAKKLRTSLGDHLPSIRKSLISMMDVNFEDFDLQRAGGASVAIVVESGRTNPPLGPALRHVKTPSAKEHALFMIRSLGELLGPKNAAFFADGCIADLHRSCVSRVESRVSLRSNSQLAWIHEWIGSLRVAQEVLVGGFAKTDAKPEAVKTDGKRLKILANLAESILPILTTHPLWDLPTFAMSSSSIPSAGQKSSQPSTALLSQRQSLDTAVAATLRGNASAMFNLLGLVGTITKLLGRGGRRFIAVILFPILEKAGLRNPSLIREKAIWILERISGACEYSDITELIGDNMDTLAGAVKMRIRAPGGGGAVSPKAVIGDDLQSVIDGFTAALRISVDSVNRDHKRSEDTLRLGTLLSSAEDLTLDLMTRFDHSAAVITSDEGKLWSFLQLFDSALLLLHAYHRVNEGRPASKQSGPPSKPTEPWFDLLAPFRKDANAELSAREGFAMYHEEKKDRAGHKTEESKMGGTRGSLMRDTRLASQVASRCQYLLSHPSLKIQIRSCEILASCFTLLGWVALNASSANGEANGPKTAVLRQVHSTWPAISARFKATVSAVTISEGTSLVFIESPAPATISQPANIGEQRIYLSKLFDLVGVITECAGDFMATRFREDVWPRIGPTMKNLSGRKNRHLERRSPRPFVTVRDEPSRNLLSESEERLLLAVVRCLSRIFGHHEAGCALAGLIPVAGALLFPLLDDPNETLVITCTEALQNMIRVDYDALWRPLLGLTGQRIPPCPLYATRQQDSRLQKGKPLTSRTARIAQELIDFTDSLPEQPLQLE